MFADYSDGAWDDIDETIEYLGQTSPRAAARFIGDLQFAVQRLVDFPELGDVRPGYEGRFRQWFFRHWTIIYRRTDAYIEIVRVFGSGQDIDTVLRRL